MIVGVRPLKVNFALSTRRRCRAFTDCDECSICIAIIAMEYQITYNVH